MSQPPIDKFLDRVGGPRRSGATSQWSCLCPAHRDRRRSLSLGSDVDGIVHIFCHAGCAVSDILKAMGLTKRDFYPRRKRQ